MISQETLKRGDVYHINYYDFVIVVNHDISNDMIYYLKGKFDKLVIESQPFNHFINDIKKKMIYIYQPEFVDSAIRVFKKYSDDRTIKLIEFFDEIACL